MKMNEKDNDHFVVSQENWSLHRKGHQDQKRHMDKVKEAIQNNLPDLISEESIVFKWREVIKIPIRSLDEYKIRYNHDKSKHVGQGDGDSQVGDVVAKRWIQGKSGRKGKQAGDQAGQDYYEAEVSIAEIEDDLIQRIGITGFRTKRASGNIQRKKLSLMIFEKKD